jgi:flagellar hook assembly protein FlgD
MKSETLKTIKNYLRGAFTGAMVVCVLLVTTFSFAANAQSISSEGINPEVKYLGTIQGKLVFQIDLQSVSENNPYVSIRDEEGNVLFTERIRDNKFSRKFAFEKEEFEGKKLSFVIYNGKEATAQSFQVSRNTRVVEDVMITRL